MKSSSLSFIGNLGELRARDSCEAWIYEETIQKQVNDIWKKSVKKDLQKKEMEHGESKQTMN